MRKTQQCRDTFVRFEGEAHASRFPSSLQQLPENLWGYAKRRRFVVDTIAQAFPGCHPDSIRILDVGCGNGTQLTLPLARRGYQITAVDPDLRSILRARGLGAEISNVRFICGTVEELSAERFDVLIVSEVLEHMRSPADLLLASLRHLQEEGILIVTVPNGYGEFEIDSQLFRALHLQALVNLAANDGQQVVGSTDHTACGHVQFFTQRRLKRLFSECSLSIVKQAPASFFCGPIIGHTLARFDWFVRWNARITDKLPLALASGWYFALQRSGKTATRE